MWYVNIHETFVLNKTISCDSFDLISCITHYTLHSIGRTKIESEEEKKEERVRDRHKEVDRERKSCQKREIVR